MCDHNKHIFSRTDCVILIKELHREFVPKKKRSYIESKNTSDHYNIKKFRSIDLT